jgi:hypothetical protein
MFFVLDPWSSAPVAYSPIRPKSQIFNIGHDYTQWIRNFKVMMKIRESRFWDLVQFPTAIIRSKSQNSNVRHDGIPSIGNFMLMINNHFARFQLPGKLLKTKKMCSLFLWQHGISYLFFLESCQESGKNTDFASFRDRCRIPMEWPYKHNQFLRLKFSRTKSLQPIPRIFILLLITHMELKFPSVTRRCRRSQKFVPHLELPPYELESRNFGSRSLLANLMCLIHRILKFDILRIPPIQISTEKG